MADVERLAFQPAGERRRREQIVEAHRQLACAPSPDRTIPDRRRRSCRTAAAGCAGSAAAGRGRGRRATSVSSTFDRKMCSRLRTGSASMPSSASRPDVAERIRSPNASASATSSGGGASNDFKHGDRDAGAGAGRVDHAVDRVAEAADALRPFAPLGEARSATARPGWRRTRRATSAARAASLSSIHGRKSLGCELRKREQQIAEVALGIDRDRRDAVERRLFQQRQAEPRLAAAGHADADGVRREVLAVVEQRLRASVSPVARSCRRPR